MFGDYNLRLLKFVFYLIGKDRWVLFLTSFLLLLRRCLCSLGQLGLLGRCYPGDFIASGLNLSLCMAAWGCMAYSSLNKAQCVTILLSGLSGWNRLLCLWPPWPWSFFPFAPFPCSTPNIPTFLFNTSLQLCYQVGPSYCCPYSNTHRYFSFSQKQVQSEFVGVCGFF